MCIIDQRTLPVRQVSLGDIAIPNESTEELSSPSREILETKEAACEQEDKKASVDLLDDDKMRRVCDKLIEVFLVDKPKASDWRRLLAFSREWDSIRPHFFSRCKEKASLEKDPGMRHRLLRLGRKLKEV